MNELAALRSRDVLAPIHLGLLISELYVLRNPLEARGWLFVVPGSFEHDEMGFDAGWNESFERPLIDPDELIPVKAQIIRKLFVPVGLLFDDTASTTRESKLTIVTSEWLRDPQNDDLPESACAPEEILPGTDVVRAMFRSWVDARTGYCPEFAIWLAALQSGHDDVTTKELRGRCLQPNSLAGRT